MGLIANFSAWLKAMRGGAQARSHEEAAKRAAEVNARYEAERKAKDDAARAKFKDRPAGSDDIAAGPG